VSSLTVNKYNGLMNKTAAHHILKMLVDEPTNIPNEFLYCFSMFLDQEYIPGPAQRLYIHKFRLEEYIG
jgi:hypothetical protein